MKQLLRVFPGISYRNCSTNSRRAVIKAAVEQIEKEKGAKPFIDTFNRVHNYLRISLTERCSLRCLYCMPEEGVPLNPNEKLLSTDEIIKLVGIFAQNGIDKVRLTGGEPTIRKDLEEVIARINGFGGINSIGITSNGIVLARKLEALKKAGLTKVNISLDTLDEGKYMMMTRRKGLKAVMKSLDVAEGLFPKVKLNNVVLRGVNDNEIFRFIELTRKRRFDVRFIEFMPFGGNHFSKDKFVSYKEMLDKIETYYGDDVIRLEDSPNDTTKAYKIKGFEGQFGFITSMSEHFCNTCNRLRITADGNLKVCLHGTAEVSLRDILRSGATDEEVTSVIQEALYKKKKKHAGFNFRNGCAQHARKQTDDPHWRVKHSLNPTNSLHSSLLLPFTSSLPSSSSQIRLFCSDNKLSHISPDGSAKQVDVSHKKITHRVATAECHVKLTPAILHQIKHNLAKKGDVLNVAKIASIMGAKQTANLIPLCHNVPINVVETNFELLEDSCLLKITCTAKTDAATGIEMEALTACSVAALTVYDMCKAVSSEMVIENIRLVRKTGGKSDYFLK